MKGELSLHQRPQMTKINHVSVKSKFLIICVFMLTLLLVSPLYAQANLAGTWQSTANGMYYNLDPTDPTLRMHDVTANFTMEITQQGNQVTIVLYLNMISYTPDQAYLDEYGFCIPAVGGGVITFAGTVSGSSFTATERDTTSSNPEKLVGTFTANTITASLNGDMEETDLNGIVVKRTSSQTSQPTVNPSYSSSAAVTPSPVGDYLNQRNLVIAAAIVFIILAAALAIRATAKSAKARSKEKAASKRPDEFGVPPPPPRSPEVSTASKPFQPNQQSSVNFCPNCGRQLVQSVNFCPVCGFQLKPSGP